MFGRQKIADLQARLNQIESERSQLQRELQADRKSTRLNSSH